MPEMPDVVTLTTISSDWGNDIRDRTIQRYSSVANRTTEHPTPSEGDLAYLADSNTVWVYDGSDWVSVYPANPALFELDDSDVAAGPEFVTSLATRATVSLTIPSSWGSWKCMAYASCELNINSGGACTFFMQIDGTNSLSQTLSVVGGHSASIGFRRTGLTTTGSRSINLRASGGGATITIGSVFLYARAVRTS